MAAPIHRQLHEAYAGADLFPALHTGDADADAGHRRAIPLIARCGSGSARCWRKQPARRGDGSYQVAMGGIGFALPVAQWPQTSDISGWCRK